MKYSVPDTSATATTSQSAIRPGRAKASWRRARIRSETAAIWVNILSFPQTDAEITTWQNYLVDLAAYMSGEKAPAFEQPMMKQYGIDHVDVAAAVRASPSATAGKNALTRKQVLDIIEAAQDDKNLPPFGSQWRYARRC